MAKNNQELITKMGNGNGNGEHKPLTIGDQVATYLKRPEVIADIRNALPSHLTPERLGRICLTTIRTTPQLMECTLPSLIAAIMQSAQLGLEPGILGHAYFVPFNKKVKGPAGEKWVKEVQFIIGYKGLLDLARRAGGIVSIGAGAIYSGDKFIYRKGFNEVLEHEPNFQDRGELAGFYAYATTSDGGRYADVMTLTEVNKIRDRSKAKDSGPWVTDFEEMGKKTVLRRMCKYLPMSVEDATKIREDEEREFSEKPSFQISLGEPENPRLEKLSAPIAEVSNEKIIVPDELQGRDLANGGTWPIVDPTDSDFDRDLEV